MPNLAQSLPLSAASLHSSTPGPAIELLIGALTATAAGLVARGLGQLWQGGQIRMSADTKRQGSEIMTALITLREGTAGDLDFDHVARTHGARALRERCDGAVSAATVDELFEAVLDILSSIART
jgi:hypothetical protein